MGEERTHEYAGRLKVGDVVSAYRWKIEAIFERDGVISATGYNEHGTQFSLCTKPTREVVIWR